MQQAQPAQSKPRSRAREERQAQRSQRQAVVAPGLPGGQYKPLSQRDVERIHEAALTVLERTGIEVMPSECHELLRAAGAKVDDSANRVFLPRQMVEKALSCAPKTVRRCGRDPKHDMVLGGTGGAALVRDIVERAWMILSEVAWPCSRVVGNADDTTRRRCDLLATHQPTPIPTATDAAIRARWPIVLPPALVATEVARG